MSESGPTEVDTGACGAPAAETDFGRPPAVIAGGITMRGPWGPVYGPGRPRDPGRRGVTVLVCPAGTPRDALLMTIAGRMKPMSGSADRVGRDAGQADLPPVRTGGDQGTRHRLRTGDGPQAT